MRLTRQQVAELWAARDAASRLDEQLEPDELQTQVCVDPGDLEATIAAFQFLFGVAQSISLMRDPLP